ncbi:MAG: hypothetical protein J5790_02735 [Bacteroidaceae bacterium]|nr:hypothetical protein [Bacteroidaceae bacterium]
MKKLVLMMVGLFLLSTAYAQDKEALKAQKEAEKAAKATFKKAKSIYETSIPNEAFGRKETDFEKLAGALPMIESAVQNEYTNKDVDTWKTAKDIQYEFYTKENAELKADPDNEQLKKQFLETNTKLINYCQKYDEYVALDPKMKPEEKSDIHQKNQIIAANSALPLLQAAQNASNSDNQEELKMGVQYADAFLSLMEKSSLMKDLEKNTLTKNFTREQIDEWLTYAKVFRAQSYFNIPGTPEETIVSAYEGLMNTKYKGVAYNSLSNFYREKDKAKQNKYLKAGVDALKNDPEQKDLRSNFAFVLMQNLYNGGEYEKDGNKDALKQAIQLIKDEFSDDENAVNAYLMDGQIAFDEKKYAEAKEIYQTACAKYPDEERCLIMAARSAWMMAQTNGSKKADMEEAIKLFKQLEAACPNEPEYWGESLYILYNNTEQTAQAAKYKKYYKAK